MDNTADSAESAASANGQDDSSSEETKKQAEAIETPAVPEVPEVYVPVPVNVKTLMAAGAHFGHQTPRWNPKMAKYIYGERNGIHILNLDVTLDHWETARKFIKDIVSRGGEVLIVGTKSQAQKAVREAAERCGAHYVVSRWLGGTLSNFQTIKNSIARMKKLTELVRKAEDPESDITLAKKERLRIKKNLVKLEANLGGIKNMRKIPDVVFVIDIIKESIAVAESRKLHVPVVGLVDTNTNPGPIDFPIPSNDDAARTIALFANAISDTVAEGKREYKARVQKEAKAAADKKKSAKAAAEKAKAKKEDAAVERAATEAAAQ